VALFCVGLAGIVVLSVANGMLVYASYADCDPIISKAIHLFSASSF
jgi:hypothetical protein